MNNAMRLSLGYIGKPYSSTYGIYILGNGYRSYHPVIKRFFSWDNTSPFGIGGQNGYGYCEQNPVGLSDPSGKGPIDEGIIVAFDMLIGVGEETIEGVEIAAEAGVESIIEVDESVTMASTDLTDLPNEMLEQVYSYLDDADLLSVQNSWPSLNSHVDDYLTRRNKRSLRKLTERIDSRLSIFSHRTAESDECVAGILQRAWTIRDSTGLSGENIHDRFNVYLRGNNDFSFSHERGITKVNRHARRQIQPQIPYVEYDFDYQNIFDLLMIAM